MIMITYYTAKQTPYEERMNGAICGIIDATVTITALQLGAASTEVTFGLAFLGVFAYLTIVFYQESGE